MGPKKKPDPGAEDNSEKIDFLTNKVQALQNQIVWQQQRADRSKTQEKNMRDEIIQIDQDFRKQKAKLFQISNKMQEQYDTAQTDLQGKVQQKKTALQDKQSQIKKGKQLLHNYKIDYQEKLRQKQKQLNDLRQKMEDMSIQFSRMLRQTLQKMQQRIQLQQWDNESDPQLIKKMKDLSQLYNN